MNRIAFIFSSAPHGVASGREGLDALIATSAFTEDIGVFFIGDGVFQLLTEQEPKDILVRNYISVFKILPLCNVKTLWICSASLKIRGLTEDTPMVVQTTVVDPEILRKKIISYNVILNF